MAFPPAGHPLSGSPAALSLFVSLHHPRLFPLAQTQKPAKHKPCGFRSGRICPVDFSVMPQQKEQIKNFFQKIRKKFQHLSPSPLILIKINALTVYAKRRKQTFILLSLRGMILAHSTG
ncbi:MAG: hypothetical protein ABID63_19325 [Pseudomonadota bacterium]